MSSEKEIIDVIIEDEILDNIDGLPLDKFIDYANNLAEKGKSSGLNDVHVAVVLGRFTEIWLVGSRIETNEEYQERIREKERKEIYAEEERKRKMQRQKDLDEYNRLKNKLNL